MSRLPWHQRLIDLSSDVVDHHLEEAEVSPATAALVRLQIVTLGSFVNARELNADDLLGLADATEVLLNFLLRNRNLLTQAQVPELEDIYTGITGLPALDTSDGGYAELDWNDDRRIRN